MLVHFSLTRKNGPLSSEDFTPSLRLFEEEELKHCLSLHRSGIGLSFKILKETCKSRSSRKLANRFCEFEEAEGVIRALNLLQNMSIGGQVRKKNFAVLQ